MNNEPGYLIRHISGDNFVVTKWEDDSEPTAIYNLKQGNRRWTCSSPGCRRSNKCKHAQLVISWIESGGRKALVPDRMLRVNGASF